MKIVKSDTVTVDKLDWEYLKAALRAYELAPFESSHLQSRVREILRKHQ